MPGKISSESPSTPPLVSRRQPLLAETLTSSVPGKHNVDAKDGIGGSRRGSRVGETAGECAAVCCCCPCAVVHLFLLAVYRLPRDLWRKKKKSSLLKKKRKIYSNENENHRKSRGDAAAEDEEEEETTTTDNEEFGGEINVVDWDDEMWDRFYGSGFWRSGSRKKDDDDE